MKVEGLVFAGIATADTDEAARCFADVLGIEPDSELYAGYGFRYRHFRAPDGRRFELLDRKT